MSDSSKNKILDIVKYLPIFVYIVIIPLVTKSKLAKYNFKFKDLYIGNHIDVFNYYKAKLIIYFAIVSFLILLYLFFKNKEKYKKILFQKKYLIIVFMAVMVIISHLFSKFPKISSRGFYTKFENTYVYLSYLFMVVYTSVIIKEKKGLTILSYMIVFSGIIMSIIGVMQYLKVDPLRFEFFRKNFLQINGKGNVNYKMPLGRVYLTIYNPNYVGTYVGMIFSYLLGIIIFFEDKILKFFSLILLPFLGLILIGSKSDAGLLTVSVVTLIFIFHNIYIFIKSDKKDIKVFIIIGILLISSFVTYKKVPEIKKMVNELKVEKNIIYGLVGIEIDNENKRQLNLKYRTKDKTYDYKIKFNTQNNQFNLQVYDSNEKVLKTENLENGSYKVIDDIIKKFNILVNKEKINNKNYIAMRIKIDNRPWDFLVNKNGFNAIRRKGENIIPVDLSIAKGTKFFDGYEKIGSTRGYIWSRSIPLIDKFVFIGGGADTYPIYFPQNDRAIKDKIGNRYIVVDKPHNIYIYYIFSFGLLFLIAFIYLNLYTVYGNIKTFNKLYYPAIYLIISYLIVGVFNDSSVTVSPIFWCVLGYLLGSTNNTLQNKNV